MSYNIGRRTDMEDDMNMVENSRRRRNYYIPQTPSINTPSDGTSIGRYVRRGRTRVSGAKQHREAMVDKVKD